MSYRVYCYTSSTTGKKYIGTTTRKYQSKRAGKGGSHYIESCPKFGRAIREYGWNDFEYSVLLITESKEEAYKMEEYYISKYNTINNGYNVSTGGRGGGTGVHKKKEGPFISTPARVYQYTKDGELLKEYPSIKEAARANHLNPSGITNNCRNRAKTYCGYVWRYADDRV